MLQFTKMQGLGNDYIYFDCVRAKAPDNPEKLSVRLSDRHFSVGGDGIVLILPSDCADFKMRMFNIDGSEGKMCGNAIRCVAKFVYERGLTEKTELTVETLSGIKTLLLSVSGGKVKTVTVNMGKPSFVCAEIPVLCGSSEAVDESITVDGRNYKYTAVSMGNPHCVVFCDDVNSVLLEKTGPQFEHHPIFPDRVNTEFVHVKSSDSIDMRVWERGSGETLACGTGACASVAACIKSGFCHENTPVKVHLTGGVLTVELKADGIYMTGPAEFSFDGRCEE